MLFRSMPVGQASTVNCVVPPGASGTLAGVTLSQETPAVACIATGPAALFFTVTCALALLDAALVSVTTAGVAESGDVDVGDWFTWMMWAASKVIPVRAVRKTPVAMPPRRSKDRRLRSERVRGTMESSEGIGVTVGEGLGVAT